MLTRPDSIRLPVKKLLAFLRALLGERHFFFRSEKHGTDTRYGKNKKAHHICCWTSEATDVLTRSLEEEASSVQQNLTLPPPQKKSLLFLLI